jgi:hypothetical protein
MVAGCDGVCGSGKVVGGCDNKCGSAEIVDDIVCQRVPLIDQRTVCAIDRCGVHKDRRHKQGK